MPRPLQFRGGQVVWVLIFALVMAIPLTAWYWFFLTPLQKHFVSFAWNQKATTGPQGGVEADGSGVAGVQDHSQAQAGARARRRCRLRDQAHDPDPAHEALP